MGYGAFGLFKSPHKATISRLLSDRDAIVMQLPEALKRKKALLSVQLQQDEAVVEFVMLAEGEKVSLSADMIIH